VKSSLSVWLAASLVLALSLSLKVAADPSMASGVRPPPRTEELRRFLAGAAAAPIEPIAAPADGKENGGWRFRYGDCQAAAFPSGPRGSLDLFARKHARRTDQLAYVYRGELRPTPPTWTLATDVIVHRLTTPFRVANEPGYVVLIYPRDCGPPSGLPWGRLPIG
jgi:hypothetical protein